MREGRVEQLRYHILGVGCTTAIAEGKKGSTAGKGPCYSLTDSYNLCAGMCERGLAQRYYLAALLDGRVPHLRQDILNAGRAPLKEEGVKEPVVLRAFGIIHRSPRTIEL